MDRELPGSRISSAAAANSSGTILRMCEHLQGVVTPQLRLKRSSRMREDGPTVSGSC